jgi:hypothetical protein
MSVCRKSSFLAIAIESRRHQEKSTISLLRQIAEVRCEEAARCRERLGDPSISYHQDAA